MSKTPMSYSSMFILWIVLLLSASVRAQEVVLAFTDTLGRSTSLDGMARSKMLVRSMARADVTQAMFLIKTKRVNQSTVDRLAFYNETGQLLVNAGHQFSLVQQQKSFGYPIDIMRANGILEPYENYHKHVNFPYLYGDNDPILLAQLQKFLAEHNYSPTYITTRVHDDYMNQLYQARIASGRTVDIRALETAFVNLVTKAVNDYDAKARMMLGFSPRQVVLLHETDLTAYCIIGLIDRLNALGYKIIAPEKVFTDPISNPFFVSGFSATSYMPYLTGLPENKVVWNEVPNEDDKEDIHRLLHEQGLHSLVDPQ